MDIILFFTRVLAVLATRILKTFLESLSLSVGQQGILEFIAHPVKN